MKTQRKGVTQALTSWLGLAALAISASLLGCDAFPYGTEGELGNGHFIYKCVEQAADPACEGLYEDPPFPAALALNASFDIYYEGDDGHGYAALQVISASERLIEDHGSSFETVSTGTAALLAVDSSGRVIDIKHVDIRAIKELRLSRSSGIGYEEDPDGWGVNSVPEWEDLDRDGATLALPADLEQELRVTGFDDRGDVLCGLATFEWQSADEGIVSLETASSGRYARLTGQGAGVAAVVVSAGAGASGGASTELQVTVQGTDTGIADTETGTATAFDTESATVDDTGSADTGSVATTATDQTSETSSDNGGTNS